MDYTQCSVCGRVVMKAHVDSTGACVLCAPVVETLADASTAKKKANA